MKSSIAKIALLQLFVQLLIATIVIINFYSDYDMEIMHLILSTLAAVSFGIGIWGILRSYSKTGKLERKKSNLSLSIIRLFFFTIYSFLGILSFISIQMSFA